MYSLRFYSQDIFCKRLIEKANIGMTDKGKGRIQREQTLADSRICHRVSKQFTHCVLVNTVPSVCDVTQSHCSAVCNHRVG